ncbi:MAG: M48 family metallopeptidase [Spirochaetaceae bacterium]
MLNSELLGAPRGCVEYVVAHELCHLREANHGRRFYALMDQLIPHWKELRRRLNREAPLGFLEPPAT